MDLGGQDRDGVTIGVNLSAGYEIRVTDTAALGFTYDSPFLTVGAFEGLEDTKSLSHNASLCFRYYLD